MDLPRANADAVCRRPHVLVVEDDEDLRALVCGLLEDEGYRVDTAANGLEALATLREIPSPELVLIDLVMPEMDGIELRVKLLDDPALAGIPVVIFTGSRDGAAIAASMKATGFIAKPVSRGPLLQIVADHIGGMVTPPER